MSMKKIYALFYQMWKEQSYPGPYDVRSSIFEKKPSPKINLHHILQMYK